MVFRKFGIFILGLGMLAGSARATTTYCALCPDTQPAFNTAVSTLSPLAALAGFPALNLQESEYTDAATGVQFLAFRDSGGIEGSASELTVNTTLLAANSDGGNAASGEVIEIVLPANIVALELNISGAGTYCTDPASTFGHNDCNNNVTVTSSSDVEFVGLTNGTPISTVWIGPSGSSSPTVAINSFEVFTAQSSTPEGPTMLLIGSGLIALFWRRRRQLPE